MKLQRLLRRSKKKNKNSRRMPLKMMTTKVRSLHRAKAKNLLLLKKKMTKRRKKNLMNYRSLLLSLYQPQKKRTKKLRIIKNYLASLMSLITRKVVSTLPKQPRLPYRRQRMSKLVNTCYLTACSNSWRSEMMRTMSIQSLPDTLAKLFSS